MDEKTATKLLMEGGSTIGDVLAAKNKRIKRLTADNERLYKTLERIVQRAEEIIPPLSINAASELASMADQALQHKEGR